jgi:hypothetical protein
VHVEIETECVEEEPEHRDEKDCAYPDDDGGEKRATPGWMVERAARRVFSGLAVRD